MTSRQAYMRDYMRKRRADKGPCRSVKLLALAEAVRDELSNSPTEKGKRLYQMAQEALG